MSTESARHDSKEDASLASAMLPVFDRILPDTSVRPAPRALRLLADGAFYTALALGVAAIIDCRQSGFVAIFLSAAGLSGQLSRILDDNRRAIYDARLPARSANRITIAHLLALFGGSLCAFAAAALWYREVELRSAFGFVFDAVTLGADTIVDRRFGAALPLLAHNVLVLAFFMALSFVYRAYGALLVLCWNACTWGLVLTLLARRGVTAGEPGATARTVLALLATVPHLVLEASAYVTGSIAAIFLSRAYAKYRLGDPVLGSATRAVARLVALSLLCLATAALIESRLPGLVATHLAR